jgi:hypothetical protein
MTGRSSLFSLLNPALVRGPCVTTPCTAKNIYVISAVHRSMLRQKEGGKVTPNRRSMLSCLAVSHNPWGSRLPFATQPSARTSVARSARPSGLPGVAVLFAARPSARTSVARSAKPSGSPGGRGCFSPHSLEVGRSVAPRCVQFASLDTHLAQARPALTERWRSSAPARPPHAEDRRPLRRAAREHALLGASGARLAPRRSCPRSWATPAAP